MRDGRAIVAALVLSLVVACASGATPGASAAETAAAQDVRRLAVEMERLHPNLFHTVPRAQFRRSVDGLVARLPRLPAPLAGLYAYDASRPLDARYTGQETFGRARVLTLDYASPLGGRVPAKLVLPAGTGPFPVVLFQHGAGPDSDQFLPEALDLAGAGVAGFMIAAPLNRPPLRPWFTFANRDRRGFVQNVVDWRRAIDLLAGRPEIDAGRIAFVGHSYGGAIAAIVAAVERRVSSVAIMAGPGRMTSFLRGQGLRTFVVGTKKQRAARRQRLARYLAYMRAIDAVAYLPHASPTALFVQLGRRDTTFARGDGQALGAAASEPKRIEWYPAGHDLCDCATRDRRGWLLARLRAT